MRISDGSSDVCSSDLVAEWHDAGRLRHRGTVFVPELLDEVWLVIAASDDAVLNAAVEAAASARRVLCNVVDDAALSSFQVPAVIASSEERRVGEEGARPGSTRWSPCHYKKKTT